MTDHAGDSGSTPAEGTPGSPERRGEILAAAFEVLSECGFQRASTLAVARRARTSKETIYNWFGSKEGLFEAMVAWQADRMNAALTEAIERDNPPPDKLLTRFGTHLLTLLMSERAITVNRVAIGEVQHHPTFARILVAKGRDRTCPPVIGYLDRKRAEGELAIEDGRKALDIFIGLLVRDLQMRVLLGVDPPPEPDFIAQRAREAAELFMRLFATQHP